jgi:hypothetical protein
MPYKSGILAAIDELKDHETGSPAAAIRRCMQDRQGETAAAAAAATNQSRVLPVSSETTSMDEISQQDDNYNVNTGIANMNTTTTASSSSTGDGSGSIAGPAAAWNETHFQTTLKSLLTKNILVQVNGSNYKYSDAYLKKRADRLREKMDSIEEEEHRRRLHHHQHHQAHHHHTSLSSSAADTATSSSQALYPREEPPKESPKKKSLHAKVKITEGRIITVLNPPSVSSQHHHNANEMDTEDDAVMNSTPTNHNNISTMVLDATSAGGGSNNYTKETAKKQRPIKIIPRKVVGGTKKMYVSQILLSLLYWQ